MYKPKFILLLSGKRKSGKDYFAEILHKRLQSSTIIRISEPLKSQYAEKHNLSHKELMTDSPYKELHRKAMIEWSDEVRAKEPGFFCEIACNNAVACDIWIVSDIRRKTDLQWFKSQFGSEVVMKTVLISCDTHTRCSRGWVFTVGVDDVASECDLDDYHEVWDVTINNSFDEELNASIEKVLALVNNCKAHF